MFTGELSRPQGRQGLLSHILDKGKGKSQDEPTQSQGPDSHKLLVAGLPKG